MIVRLFDRPAEQGRAIGAFAFTGAVGASAGLIIGGLLVQYASWHWIFFVNLPVGAGRLARGVAGAARRPGPRPAGGRGLARRGSGDRRRHARGASRSPRPRDWWAGLVAVALLAAFAARQATARTPLLPPRVLASRNVVGANLAQLLIIGAAMGFQVIVTLYMQRALGFGPAAAGPRARPDRRRDRRRLARPVGAADRAVRRPAAAARRPGHDHGRARPADPGARARRLRRRGLLPLFVLFGIGGGLTLPAVTALGMSGATDADAGVISGVFNTVQQVGGALGLAAADRARRLAHRRRHLRAGADQRVPPRLGGRARSSAASPSWWPRSRCASRARQPRTR